MAFFILNTGEGANHLEWVQGINVVGTESENSFFPASNLAGAYALEPMRPWAADNPAGADEGLTFDKNQVINGGAELTTLEGWATINTVVNVTTPVNSGARAFSLTPTAELLSSIVQDVQVRAGEKITVTVALRGSGTVVARAMAFIPELGVYLTSGGAWDASEQDFATRTAATYATTTLSLFVPAYTQLVPSGVYTLRLTGYAEAGVQQTVFVDDFYMWHWTDLVALIGHNVMPALSAFELRRSTDNFVANDVLEASLTIYNPNTFHLLSTMRGERWWKHHTVGVNEVVTYPYALWEGQPWFSQKVLFERSPNFGLQEVIHREQVRLASTAGAEKIHTKHDIPVTDIKFSWRHTDIAEYQFNRDRIFRQCGMGETPALLIRSTDRPESAYMVRPPAEFGIDYLDAVEVRDAGEMTFTGLAYPTFD